MSDKKDETAIKSNLIKPADDPPQKLTSDMVENAHASGDGSIKRSTESLNAEEGDTDTTETKNPY